MRRPLTSQLLLQAVGSVCVKGVSLVLLPFSTRFLSPEKMGLFALYNSFITILSVCIALGLRQLFWLEYCRKNHQERKEMLNDLMLLYGCIALPALAVLFFFRDALNSVLFVGAGTTALLTVSLFFCFLIFFVELLYQVLIYQQQLQRALFLQLGNAMLTVFTTLLLLYQGFGVLGMLSAQLAGSMVVVIYGFVQYHAKKMHTHISLARLRFAWQRYIRDGILFVPSLLSMWVISSSTRWILAQYSLAFVGMYAVIEMVATVFQLLFIRPLQTVYAPALFEQFTVADAHTVDNKNKKYMWLTMAALTVLVMLGYGLLKPVALWLLPANYAPVVPLSLVMAIAQIILVGTNFAICYIQFCKRLGLVNLSLSIAAMLNALLALLLVPCMGLLGALLAFLGAVLVYFMLLLRFNWRLHKRS